MSWLTYLIVTAGVLAVAYLVFRSPAFWASLIVAAIKAAWPVMAKRMTPEQEAEFQKAVRQGREWDPFRKRAREK